MSIDEMLKALDGIVQEARERAADADSEDSIAALRRDYLGKKGKVQQVLRGIAGLPPEDRPKVGATANKTKKALDELFEAQKDVLAEKALQADLENRQVDLTLPGRKPPAGAAHPIVAVQREVEIIFSRLGFEVARGPQCETDLFNFEALNFPQDHPARDMQDTLVLEEDRLLRTHTSPVQIRTMLAYEPPIRIIAPGVVYRRDDDITHSPMFFQVEGLHVDRGVNLGHLKAILARFASEFFGRETPVRLRPSFFPFTEPSVEVDIGCPFCGGDGCRVCSHTGWLEILGAGMVDPNVLEMSGIDPEEYSGWAFGIGVDRLAMLRYGIRNIRLLYESDVRFLEQFA